MLGKASVLQRPAKLSNRRPDVGGLFSMKDAKVKISRWHFDLNSEGYEDQP
jgi:hypothetical protein